MLKPLCSTDLKSDHVRACLQMENKRALFFEKKAHKTPNTPKISMFLVLTLPSIIEA